MQLPGTMLAPIPWGVLTRRDDPDTPEDERLHDENSRDAGVRGNVTNWPVVACFPGRVYSAGVLGGYGLTVRIEGAIAVPRARLALARRFWPLQSLPDADPLILEARALYGHHNALWCQTGEDVQRFQPLGGMGNTGKSSGNHVHVKLRLLSLPKPACYVDPLPIFVYARS